MHTARGVEVAKMYSRGGRLAAGPHHSQTQSGSGQFSPSLSCAQSNPNSNERPLLAAPDRSTNPCSQPH